MLSNQLTKQLFLLTDKEDLEQSLKMLLPDYIKLKIYFIKQQIAQFEMKWNMTYTEFEEKSKDTPYGFSYELEQEYYKWGWKTGFVRTLSSNDSKMDLIQFDNELRNAISSLPYVTDVYIKTEKFGYWQR